MSAVAFAKVKREKSLPATVSAAIKERIRAGALSAGHRLASEAILATEFGVSRAVIREAISQLKHEGLVDSRQGVGAFVADPIDRGVFRISADCFEKRKELGKLLELQTTIQGDGAALAAANRSAAQLKDIESHFQRMAHAQALGQAALSPRLDAELDFYRAIATASGNGFFVDFLRLIDARFMMKLRQAAINNTRTAEMHAAALREHEQVLEAIRSRDADGARQAARSHFAKAAERLAQRRDIRD